MPRLLTNLAGESLWRGDVIRLVHNYDLGSGSPPVDLLVYDPRDDETGLGVITVSGYKAGLTLSIFPKESTAAGKRSLEVSWLLDNWEKWFCYSYENGADGMPKPLPVEGTLVLDWSEREIVIRTDADSRSA